MQKLLTFLFSKNISVYAIFDDQNFKDTTSLVLNNFAQNFRIYTIYRENDQTI